MALTPQDDREANVGRARNPRLKSLAAMHVLNIQSSPRRSTSASIALADAFIDAFRRGNPSIELDTLNVWDEQLPEFDHEAIGAKYKGVAGLPMDEAEAALWESIQSLAARFQRADRIVIGVPMWNFSFPYKLKQLIDLASQRNLLFTFDGKSFGPALHTPRAMVIYTRGQAYAEDGPLPPSQHDHQTPFIEFWLRFIGVQDVRSLTLEDTWSAPEQRAQALAKGMCRAAELAKDF